VGLLDFIPVLEDIIKNWDYYSTWEVFQKGSAKSISFKTMRNREKER
jgi:hypothetical protein